MKFDGSNDESFYAQITSNRYRTDHHELKIKMDLANDIEKIVSAYGEPFFDNSAIPSYYIGKEAKKYVTVILNGDGADELFGGYRRHIISNNFTNKIGKALYYIFKYLPRSRNKESYYTYIKRFSTLARKRGLDKYIRLTTDIFSDYYDFDNTKLGPLLIENSNKSFNKLEEVLIADFKYLLFSNLLVKIDASNAKWFRRSKSFP